MRTMTKLGCSLAMLTALFARPAHAQTDEQRADARAAAIEGAKAFSEGRFADAVDYFSRAESLVHAPPHLLYMARSQAKLGKIVKAAEVYRRIVNEQLADGAPPAFQRAHNDAATELPPIEERIPTVKIVLEGADAKDVVVTMDGATVSSALVGLPRPVDPGDHKFQATGNGIQSDDTPLTVAERAHETVTLVLKPAPGVMLPVAGGSAPVVAPEAAKEAPKEAPPPSAADNGAPSSGGSSVLRPISYAAFGVGALGLGLGTVFALQSHSTKGDVEKACPGGYCPVADEGHISDLQSKANSQGRLAYVGFVVGGVGVAAGVTLFILGGKSHSGGEQARVETWVGPSSLGVRGKF